MATLLSERSGIVSTLALVRDALDRDQKELAALQVRIREHQDLLALWDAKLAALDAGGVPQRKRRARGEPRRVIEGLLRDAPAGLTSTEISQQGGLSWSTAKAALANNSNVFIEREGRWLLAAPPREEKAAG